MGVTHSMQWLFLGHAPQRDGPGCFGAVRILSLILNRAHKRYREFKQPVCGYIQVHNKKGVKQRLNSFLGGGGRGVVVVRSYQFTLINSTTS